MRSNLEQPPQSCNVARGIEQTRKNGTIVQTSFANVALFQGNNHLKIKTLQISYHRGPSVPRLKQFQAACWNDSWGLKDFSSLYWTIRTFLSSVQWGQAAIGQKDAKGSARHVGPALAPCACSSGTGKTPVPYCASIPPVHKESLHSSIRWNGIFSKIAAIVPLSKYLPALRICKTWNYHCWLLPICQCTTWISSSPPDTSSLAWGMKKIHWLWSPQWLVDNQQSLAVQHGRKGQAHFLGTFQPSTNTWSDLELANVVANAREVKSSNQTSKRKFKPSCDQYILQKCLQLFLWN